MTPACTGAERDPLAQEMATVRRRHIRRMELQNLARDVQDARRQFVGADGSLQGALARA